MNVQVISLNVERNRCILSFETGMAECNPTVIYCSKAADQIKMYDNTIMIKEIGGKYDGTQDDETDTNQHSVQQCFPNQVFNVILFLPFLEMERDGEKHS